jgi:hypothetical protein
MDHPPREQIRLPFHGEAAAEARQVFVAIGGSPSRSREVAREMRGAAGSAFCNASRGARADKRDYGFSVA